MSFKLISELFRGFASKVLGVDDTAVPKEQMAILKDLLAKFRFRIKPNADIDEMLSVLKRKHLVDSITLAAKDGSLIVSSEGNGSSEAVSGTALLNYVHSEFSEPDSVLIKLGNSWFVLMPFKEKIYIVKSSSDISTIELKALARELEELLKKEAVVEV